MEEKKKDISSEKETFKINFHSKGKPTYLRECPLNLNQFFEDKLIEQLDPINHCFLLPIDFHLDSSRQIRMKFLEFIFYF